LKGLRTRHLVVIVLVLLAVVEIVSLAFAINVKLDNIGVEPAQKILKISEIRGPRIDDQAAMIVVDENHREAVMLVSACSTLPLNVWVFLLMVYVALLIFNFSYTFQQSVKPQWRWEVLYGLLAIIGWYAWDECREQSWFPFAVVKFGLIIFTIYVYLLEKKSGQKDLK